QPADAGGNEDPDRAEPALPRTAHQRRRREVAWADDTMLRRDEDRRRVERVDEPAAVDLLHGGREADRIEFRAVARHEDELERDLLRKRVVQGPTVPARAARGVRVNRDVALRPRSASHAATLLRRDQVVRGRDVVAADGRGDE